MISIAHHSLLPSSIITELDYIESNLTIEESVYEFLRRELLYYHTHSIINSTETTNTNSNTSTINTNTTTINSNNINTINNNTTINNTIITTNSIANTTSTIDTELKLKQLKLATPAALLRLYKESQYNRLKTIINTITADTNTNTNNNNTDNTTITALQLEIDSLHQQLRTSAIQNVSEVRRRVNLVKDHYESKLQLLKQQQRTINTSSSVNSPIITALSATAVNQSIITTPLAPMLLPRIPIQLSMDPIIRSINIKLQLTNLPIIIDNNNNNNSQQQLLIALFTTESAIEQFNYCGQTEKQLYNSNNHSNTVSFNRSLTLRKFNTNQLLEFRFSLYQVNNNSNDNESAAQQEEKQQLGTVCIDSYTLFTAIQNNSNQFIPMINTNQHLVNKQYNCRTEPVNNNLLQQIELIETDSTTNNSIRRCECLLIDMNNSPLAERTKLIITVTCNPPLTVQSYPPAPVPAAVVVDTIITPSIVEEQPIIVPIPISNSNNDTNIPERAVSPTSLDSIDADISALLAETSNDYQPIIISDAETQTDTADYDLDLINSNEKEIPIHNINNNNNNNSNNSSVSLIQLQSQIFILESQLDCEQRSKSKSNTELNQSLSVIQQQQEQIQLLQSQLLNQLNDSADLEYTKQTRIITMDSATQYDSNIINDDSNNNNQLIIDADIDDEKHNSNNNNINNKSNTTDIGIDTNPNIPSDSLILYPLQPILIGLSTILGVDFIESQSLLSLSSQSILTKVIELFKQQWNIAIKLFTRSMDNNSNNTTNNSNNTNNNQLLSLTNLIQSHSLWQSDSIIRHCNNCLIEFSLFNRKHHCRLCFHIYCNNCCNQYIALQTVLLTNTSTNKNNHTNNSSSSSSSRDRCCHNCFSIWQCAINSHSSITANTIIHY